MLGRPRPKAIQIEFAETTTTKVYINGRAETVLTQHPQVGVKEFLTKEQLANFKKGRK